MLNKARDGIICSYCTNEYSGDFIYYSIDIDKVDVDKWIRLPRVRELSLDFCEECMQSYKDRLLQTYVVPKKGIFVCDISGLREASGNFAFYYCLVSKVVVNHSDQPYICSKCNIKKNIGDSACPECDKNSKLVRTAKVDVDKSHLEFNISTYVFNLLLEHLKVNGEIKD